MLTHPAPVHTYIFVHKCFLNLYVTAISLIRSTSVSGNWASWITVQNTSEITLIRDFHETQSYFMEEVLSDVFWLLCLNSGQMLYL